MTDELDLAWSFLTPSILTPFEVAFLGSLALADSVIPTPSRSLVESVGLGCRANGSYL